MARLKTYYCVTSRFYSDGRMSATISANVKDYRIPQATYQSTANCDTYNDWFESYLEAKQFVQETKELHEETKAKGQRNPFQRGRLV